MYIDKDSYASFNFVAPKNMPSESINEVLFPCHKAQSSDASEAVKIEQMINNVDMGELAENVTLDLDVHRQVTPGAVLQVKAKSDDTARTLTLGTGFLGTSIPGTIEKTKVQTFMYDGSVFVPIGTVVQLD